MQVVCSCPACSRAVQCEISPATGELRCLSCGWKRPIPHPQDGATPPAQCLACDCSDLWRQKDFPQKVGVALVALGVILSSIAVFQYMPVTALGVLLAFALADMLLFALMPDVLVCYRCGARHRRIDSSETCPRFNLETAERYRQEAARMSEVRGAAGAPHEFSAGAGPR